MRRQIITQPLRQLRLFAEIGGGEFFSRQPTSSYQDGSLQMRFYQEGAL
ncbi:MAG: hypothetical protein IIC82_09125 [Chloroflexi bacterium]|nr:hypothetical protein [Chloroflexota bacterium]